MPHKMITRVSERGVHSFQIKLRDNARIEVNVSYLVTLPFLGCSLKKTSGPDFSAPSKS